MRYPIERSRYWVDSGWSSKARHQTAKGVTNRYTPTGSLTGCNHDRGVNESGTLLTTHTGNYADLHS
jgi:hypothetical protein